MFIAKSCSIDADSHAVQSY